MRIRSCRVEGHAMGLFILKINTKRVSNKMKRFLGILVASMFLASVAYAAEPDRKVGIVGEEKKADEKAKSDSKTGATPERKTGDSKVGFVGEEKKAGEKTKSDS